MAPKVFETLPALQVLYDQGRKRLEAKRRITVGMGTCGRAAGAAEVFNALKAQANVSGQALSAMQISPSGQTRASGQTPATAQTPAATQAPAAAQTSAAAQAPIEVVAVGCKGLCYAEPLVEVTLQENACVQKFLLANIEEKDAKFIVSLARTGKVPQPLASKVIDGVRPLEVRRVLSDCGTIDPSSLEEYVASGGYEAFVAALKLSVEEVIALVDQAGLRGRGGAGFPTAKKWRAATETQSEDGIRYFVVNGDEGDPGAYMDRGLLESNPHCVLEGMMIGAYAAQASRAIFFIRAEYPQAVQAIQCAIAQAYAAGLLGSDILGSGYSLEVRVERGAGAFLCGESTAMMNVLENKRFTTRTKPPHLTEYGLWGKPTCVNNVETLANVPLIVKNGAEWFQGVGTTESPGTKVFSLTGAVDFGGLVEVPLGTTLSEVIFEIAHAQDPKAVQIGGPSGALLPASLRDVEISFEGLKDAGAMMGSGGFVVIDKNQCVVETALYLTRFGKEQSCNKCALCRRGLQTVMELLEKICEGKGTKADLDEIEALAVRNAHSNLCGLGRTALNPVLSSLRYFKDEYEAHLKGECPGHVCEALISYAIVKEKCQGERCCLLTCPGNAIKGRFGNPGRIVPRLCQKCGMCVIACPYKAVEIVSPAL